MAQTEQSMQSMLPPGPQTPGARSHHSRTFSFRSDKSGGSKEQESPRDKARRDSIWKTNSKANPNAALTEAQPGGAFQPFSFTRNILVRRFLSRHRTICTFFFSIMALTMSPNRDVHADPPSVNAVLEQSTLSSLRGFQHRDASGNVISESDRAFCSRASTSNHRMQPIRTFPTQRARVWNDP